MIQDIKNTAIRVLSPEHEKQVIAAYERAGGKITHEIFPYMSNETWDYVYVTEGGTISTCKEIVLRRGMAILTLEQLEEFIAAKERPEPKYKVGDTLKRKSNGYVGEVKDVRWCCCQWDYNIGEPNDAKNVVCTLCKAGIDVFNCHEGYWAAEAYELVSKAAEKPDMVNHPSHYTQHKYECIDVIEEVTKNLTGLEAHCIGNIFKYLWRYKDKNGKEDVEKAGWYLARLVKTLEENGK